MMEIQRRTHINLSAAQREVLCDELTSSNQVRTAKLMAMLSSWDAADQAAAAATETRIGDLPIGGFVAGA